MTTLQRAEAAEHALPREPLPPCCVLGRRGFEFGLVGSYLARQLAALPLKGLPPLRGLGMLAQTTIASNDETSGRLSRLQLVSSARTRYVPRKAA